MDLAIRRSPREDAGRREGEGGRPRLGLLEWIHYEDRAHVERLLADMRRLGIDELRTGISWADSHSPDSAAWFDWLIPRLAREVRVLPCFLYTPPSIGLEPKTNSPPRDPREYGWFVAATLDRYGEHLDWVELWNEPNNLSEWNWLLDPGWRIFADMVVPAAEAAHERGKRTVLGGMSPVDAEWLQLLADYGVLRHVDAVGIHAFPGAWEGIWRGWPHLVEEVRRVLRDRGVQAEVWVTETGYSTWRHQHYDQLRALVEVLAAPAERVYWYGLHDLAGDRSTVSGFHLDDREYHFGLKTADGRGKPLYHLWASGGVEGVRRAVGLGANAVRHAREERPVLITGGAGFVGTNLADRLLADGQPVVVYDNLSRPGVEENLAWLRGRHGDLLEARLADVRDRYALREAVERAAMVYHLAAQVAVTTSLESPTDDMETNVGGTLNLLEELRALDRPPGLVFTSTNKVYGQLEDLALARNGTRYEPLDSVLGGQGVSEERPLVFRSPYGCSKGAADQYVLDYAHTFGLPTVVFRMSCIYGPHQWGTEDQGWIAHFILRALAGEPITIYGDGMQVRDALYVDDLVEALLLARERLVARRGAARGGGAFNIGGGPRNTLSLLELLAQIEALSGRRPGVRFVDWRAGDQRYYVSDIRAYRRATGWRPRVGVRDGVERLYRWLVENRGGVATPEAVALQAGAAPAPSRREAHRARSGAGGT